MRRPGIIAALGLTALILMGGCQGEKETPESNTPPAGPTSPGAAAKEHPGQPAAESVLGRKVKNALATTKGIDASKITVDATPDGTVTLKGTVPTADQKAAAEKAAKGVPGVKSVQDQLTVAP